MKEAYLYKKLGDSRVQCQNCAQQCIIAPGERGICGVRENREGKLYSLVYGKAISCNPDPIEKKPFYHFLPGTRSLSIATVGCQFSCQSCFTPQTIIASQDGPVTIREIFNQGKDSYVKPDGTKVRRVKGREVVTHKGHYKKIQEAFRHPYQGEVLRIKPHYSPKIECTPSHEFFVTRDPPQGKVRKVRADELSKEDYLLMPKNLPFTSKGIQLDSKQILSSHNPPLLKKSTKLTKKDAQEILRLSEQGATSKELAQKFDFRAGYIRMLRSKFRKKGISSYLFYHQNKLIEENNKIKFKSEKNLVLPRWIKLDKKIAELLGWYCAEGYVSRSTDRPNSYRLEFSLGPKERENIERVKKIIREKFDVNPQITKKRTALVIQIGRTSLALFFKKICGTGAKNKKVPQILFQARREVIKAFLEGYIAGDGSIQEEELHGGTVSEELALGIYLLFLKLGFLPSFYKWIPAPKKKIEGRKVNQAPYYYVKLKAQKFRKRFLNDENLEVSSHSKETVLFEESDSYYFIPIHKISKKKYSGYVYNIQVKGDHSYLANFISVKNCQNWRISQGPKLNQRIEGENLPPSKIVEIATLQQLISISYTYTDPIVFSEYSLDTMKLAKKKDLKNTWVTSGFFSKQLLEEVAPYLDAANVDLKSMSNDYYQEYCGGRLQPVLDTLVGMKQKGIWVEVTSLVIPTLTDSKQNFEEIAKFIAEDLGPETPWHISRFSGAISWKLKEIPDTPLETLNTAYQIGKEAGLKYVYIGNVPGQKGEDTFCPNCNKKMIDRTGYSIERHDDQGKCSECGASLELIE